MTCELRHRSAKSGVLIACARDAVRPFPPRPRQTRPASRPRCLTMARRSLAHNFQAVWYGTAIMALCWPAMPSEVKFAADSLLEEAGFEPLVPRRRPVSSCCGCRSRSRRVFGWRECCRQIRSRKLASRGDRWFKFGFLRHRCDEPGRKPGVGSLAFRDYVWRGPGLVCNPRSCRQFAR
jgi:hypothetical protein